MTTVPRETLWPARRVTALRKATGLSVERFARRLDVSYQTVWHWERGDRVPTMARTVDALKALADELGFQE